MNLSGAVCGGLAAGVLGAAAWAALAYFAGVESGIVAWGIGGIVGFGTALGSRGGSAATASIAVLITVVAICAGKYLAVHFSLNKAFAELQGEEMQISEEELISYFADDEITVRTDRGEEIDWPPGADIDFPAAESDYPADVWKIALDKWNAMSEDERAAFKDQKENDGNAMLDDFKRQLAKDSFLQSFGILDIVFFLLAIVTAWQIAINDPE
ncbi:MAG: hypothetical protein ACR2NP_18030 [Pirellulaceae bacterium]